MPVQEVRVHGLKELQRALKKLGSDESKELDRELIEGGRIVADAANPKVSMFETSGSFKAQTKGFGRVVVRRSRSKHKRGDFGALLMVRALLPARAESQERVIEHVDRMIGRLAGEGGF